MKKYKVVEVIKYSAESLEKEINQKAKDGWSLFEITSTQIMGTTSKVLLVFSKTNN